MKKELTKFKPLFWFLNADKLDPQKDRNLIVHQVLSYGTLDDLRRLLKLYGKAAVRREFKKPAPGLYQPSILNFCQHVLGIKKINPKRYLKKIHETSFRNS